MTAQTVLIRYFNALKAAIVFLERAVVARDQGPWGARPHDILGAVMSANLARLENATSAFALQARYQDRFRIDLQESGFPVLQEIMALAEAEQQASARLEALADPTAIKRKMVDQMLASRNKPHALQKQMAERLFYQELRRTAAADGIFPAFTAPKTIRLSSNPKNGRPYYVVYWSVYDGTANLPLLYTLVVEDSAASVADGRAEAVFEAAMRPPAGKPLRARAEQGMEGLPNTAVSKAFSGFVEANSAYSLTLTTIATAMDQQFDALHPKQLRRFVLGPFYAGGITTHNELMQGLLDKVDASADSWVLTWTMQELFSESEKPGQRRFWSQSPPQQIFYINTDDIDCVQQGVSAVEYHALIPHAAYQAVYASGQAAEVFGRYQCSIVSEDDIIRQI
uniref:hypothetical protein n=1 Tax=Pararhizobium sp. IMCC3301 TaxID=3067904 RepID=UPI0027428C56|nr:hypothetical protein [Pararhizobium sp. IMCC3301]